MGRGEELGEGRGRLGGVLNVTIERGNSLISR